MSTPYVLDTEYFIALSGKSEMIARKGLLECASLHMNSDNERAFIDLANKINFDDNYWLGCELATLYGSDALIREFAEYDPIEVMSYAVRYSEERARHVIRVIGGGWDLYVNVLTSCACNMTMCNTNKGAFNGTPTY